MKNYINYGLFLFEQCNFFILHQIEFESLVGEHMDDIYIAFINYL